VGIRNDSINDCGVSDIPNLSEETVDKFPHCFLVA